MYDQYNLIYEHLEKYIESVSREFKTKQQDVALKFTPTTIKIGAVYNPKFLSFREQIYLQAVEKLSVRFDNMDQSALRKVIKKHPHGLSLMLKLVDENENLLEDLRNLDYFAVADSIARHRYKLKKTKIQEKTV